MLSLEIQVLRPDRQPARERNAHPSTRRDFSGLIQVGLQVPDAPKRFGRIGRPTCSRKRQHSYDAEGPTTHPLQGSEPKAISGMTKCLSMKSLVGLVLLLVCATGVSRAQDAIPQYRDLFNGKDLTGWVNVNTDPDTWTVKDGVLICKGKPIGVMRTDRQYENFVLHIEWKHMEAGGNSGVFAWSDANPNPKTRLPNGVEIQMLELDYVKLHKAQDGSPLAEAYVTGDLFGVAGVQITPDTPRGPRSSALESRCKPRGEWNTYDVVAVDGVIKLCG